jgi:hypothetical protein
VIQQAIWDQSLSRAQVFQWHARFKTGHTSAEDDEHTGRPTSCTTPETVAKILDVVLSIWPDCQCKQLALPSRLNKL